MRVRFASSTWAFAAVAVACSDAEPAATQAAACSGTELLVAGSDYQSSLVCAAPGCIEDARTTGLALGVDPSLATSGARAFYVARDMDAVFELDARCGTPFAKVSVAELATKNPIDGSTRNANPHDAAAAPDGTVMITLFNTPRIAFARDGRLDARTIDLAPFDEDGNPQADAIRIVEIDGRSKAFVTLERLDDAAQLASTRASKMLRIDVATATVEAAIDLAGRNPFNAIAELDGALFLAEPGDFHAANEPLAGIERFETVTGATRILVREQDLGGSVAEVAVTNGCGAAIVAGPDRDINPTMLVTFDPATGRVITGGASSAPPALGPTPGYDLQALAWRGRTLYVGDRRRAARGYPVHVLEDRGDCTLVDTGRTIDLPQKPVALRPAN